MKLRAYDGGPVLKAENGEFLVVWDGDWHARLAVYARDAGYGGVVIVAPHGFYKAGEWPQGFGVFFVTRDGVCDLEPDRKKCKRADVRQTAFRWGVCDADD